MKIIAENETARVEVSIRVTSPNKYLTRSEVQKLRSYIGDALIGVIGKAPYAGFSITNKDIKIR